ncbi:uncharacterized protein LOC122327527 isoform X2 [Puntigrus tetrazona]|uniref:uncharacterized protein LOC122327527 isoform X2 n=1 Tax=Puntigrus tetrazona TaxID=1606681 RepID=UPI001C894186|nr:uncharacterized protein LOC122327527 isoform X2 [Puntigrus tetrazona]
MSQKKKKKHRDCLKSRSSALRTRFISNYSLNLFLCINATRATSLKMNPECLWRFCVLVLLGKASVSFADAEMQRVSVMEGRPVTLNSGVIAKHHETIKWYFNETLVVAINKDQVKICTVSDCKNRFGNRLMVDNQTGSLTITNTRTTDSGEYHLDVISNGKDSEKTFNVTVNGAPKNHHQTKGDPVTEKESGSGLSPAAVTGIFVAVLLVVAAAFGVIYCYKRRTRTSTRGRDTVLEVL